MAVLNIHTRTLPVSEAEAGALLDALASPADRIWPVGLWPPMRFDRPLGVGATGGHGPIHYTVVGYQPGRWVRFRFDAPGGWNGFHEFTIEPADEGVELRHLLTIDPSVGGRLQWALAYRWMHDACLEDAFDRAERELTGSVREPAHWSPYVRFLRTLVR
ncbi:SRPBCC family protein [Nocardia sp. NPDC127526]|uniref:SRPBCC family protein n=1 Tax=Nocardia sp. NPDC127526 TaxID=3345393 RepID=UPI003626871C